VADYPFTTLVPNLGVCEPYGPEGGSMLLLDIPGLIQGASDGKGLGLAFLRHTEGCRLLIHLVSGESDTPADDFVAINRELAQYSPRLAVTPQVVVLSKVDLPHVAARVPAAMEALRAVVPHGRIMCISAQSGVNIEQLVGRTYKLLQEQKAGSLKIQSVPSSSSAEGAEGLVTNNR
jgi:GTP-binding protein